MVTDVHIYHVLHPSPAGKSVPSSNVSPLYSQPINKEILFLENT